MGLETSEQVPFRSDAVHVGSSSLVTQASTALAEKSLEELIGGIRSGAEQR